MIKEEIPLNTNAHIIISEDYSINKFSSRTQYMQLNYKLKDLNFMQFRSFLSSNKESNTETLLNIPIILNANNVSSFKTKFTESINCFDVQVSENES